MQLLPGVLDVKGSPFEQSMWDTLVNNTKYVEGILVLETLVWESET